MRLPGKRTAHAEGLSHSTHFTATIVGKKRAPGTRTRICAMLVALLVLALAATAMAAGLSRTEQYSAFKEARDAIIEKYGFTNEALGLFYPESTQAGDAYTLTYSPIKYPDRFGVYTAVVRDGEAPAVSWTYDTVDPIYWASGELSDSVWSAAHGDKYYALEQAYWDRIAEHNAQNGDRWMTFEELAALDAMLMESGLPGGVAGYIVSALPSEDDLSKEEAIALARQTVIDIYGITEETLDPYFTHVSFSVDKLNGESMYAVSFATETGVWDPELGEFRVTLQSPSGFVTGSYWSVDKHYRTLPDGPLDRYVDAIREYVDGGSLFVLPHAEKAALAERITEAGYRLNNHFLVPGEAHISEQEAIDLAKETLYARYDLTDDMVSLFKTDTSFQLHGDKPSWVIGFVPRDNILWPFPERLGEYWITIVGESGEIRQALWSLETVALDPTMYKESAWGGAPAWNASVLPWAIEFVKAYQAFEQMPEDNRWSLEGIAAHDQLFRDAGFDRTQYRAGLPGPEDLTQEQAFDIAKEAMIVEYGLTESQINDNRIAEGFSVADPDAPAWSFHLFIGGSSICSVTINARTGQVADILYMTTGNG